MKRAVSKGCAIDPVFKRDYDLLLDALSAMNHKKTRPGCEFKSFNEKLKNTTPTEDHISWMKKIDPNTDRKNFKKIDKIFVVRFRYAIFWGGDFRENFCPFFEFFLGRRFSRKFLPFEMREL
jgi:hypothetical protein